MVWVSGNEGSRNELGELERCDGMGLCVPLRLDNLNLTRLFCPSWGAGESERVRRKLELYACRGTLPLRSWREMVAAFSD